MAKIGELQVGTLKIEESAISGYISGTTLITVNQSYGMPNQIYARGLITYGSPVKGNGSATVTVRRSSSPATIYYTQTFNFSGNGAFAQNFDAAVLDADHDEEETYQIQFSSTVSDPSLMSITLTQAYLVCVYEKV